MSWLHWVLIPLAVLLTPYLLQRGLKADAEQVGEWKMLRPGPKDYAIVFGGLACLVFLLTMGQLGLTRIKTDTIELLCLLALIMFLGGAAAVVCFLSFVRRVHFNAEQIKWISCMLRWRSMKLSEIVRVHHNFSAGWSRVWSAGDERLTILHSNHGAVELLQVIGLPREDSPSLDPDLSAEQ